MFKNPKSKLFFYTIQAIYIHVKIIHVYIYITVEKPNIKYTKYLNKKIYIM